MADEFAGCDKFVAHPGAPSNETLRGAEHRCVLAVGPEGGWTEDEVAMLESKGFRRHSLGGRILRTDTATIAAVAQLMVTYGSVQ